MAGELSFELGCVLNHLERPVDLFFCILISLHAYNFAAHLPCCTLIYCEFILLRITLTLFFFALTLVCPYFFSHLPLRDRMNLEPSKAHELSRMVLDTG